MLRALLVLTWIAVVPRAQALKLDPTCINGPTAPTMESVGLESVPDQISVPAAVCAEIVEAAERNGYSSEADSIDNRVVLDINVFNHGKVLNPPIYKLLEPYLPTMKQALDSRFLGQPGVANKLGWIFLRKYEAGHRRDELKAHHDDNLHTINLPLNDQYEGGMLFFIPPQSVLGKAIVDDLTEVGNYIQGRDVLHRCNTSDYFFPYLSVGKGSIYNKTLWHGVTQVTAGSRYTLSFFYDEPKPQEKAVTTEVLITFINNVGIATGRFGLFWVRNIGAVTDADGELLSVSQVSVDSSDLVNILEEGEEWGANQQHQEQSHVGHVFLAQLDGRNMKLWRVKDREEAQFWLTDGDMATGSDREL